MQRYEAARSGSLKKEAAILGKMGARDDRDNREGRKRREGREGREGGEEGDEEGGRGEDIEGGYAGNVGDAVENLFINLLEHDVETSIDQAILVLENAGQEGYATLGAFAGK